ncbi:MAG: hypothetical protein ABII71_05640 [Candidatus Micrarchaeota archaeon]
MKTRILLILMLALSLAFARSEIPYVYEEEDFGNEALPRFLYSLSVDCETGDIRQEVFNEQVEPIQGVNSYLKYHDYATPLISSGSTDSDGVVTHTIPGNINLMTGLFILVIEKTGYMSKEIHFNNDPCFVEKPEPAPPAPEPEPEAPPVEPPQTPPAEQPEPAPVEPADNITPPEDDGSGAGPAAPVEGRTQGCAAPAALVLISSVLAFRARN